MTKVKPKVVVFYSVGVEYDHLLFAQDVLRFFSDIANKDNFNFDCDDRLGQFE